MSARESRPLDGIAAVRGLARDVAKHENGADLRGHVAFDGEAEVGRGALGFSAAITGTVDGPWREAAAVTVTLDRPRWLTVTVFVDGTGTITAPNVALSVGGTPGAAGRPIVTTMVPYYGGRMSGVCTFPLTWPQGTWRFCMFVPVGLTILLASITVADLGRFASP